MARFIVSGTQGGADTAVHTIIETGLTVDSKSGISIYAMEVYWQNGESAAAADWELRAELNTETGGALMSATENIATIGWGLQNTAGVAVAVPYEPYKQIVLLEPRVTVQPELFFSIVSTLTAQANTCIARIYYDVVKLTDLEVMRLLVGGA